MITDNHEWPWTTTNCDERDFFWSWICPSENGSSNINFPQRGKQIWTRGALLLALCSLSPGYCLQGPHPPVGGGLDCSLSMFGWGNPAGLARFFFPGDQRELRSLTPKPSTPKLAKNPHFLAIFFQTKFSRSTLKTSFPCDAGRIFFHFGGTLGPPRPQAIACLPPTFLCFHSAHPSVYHHYQRHHPVSSPVLFLVPDEQVCGNEEQVALGKLACLHNTVHNTVLPWRWEDDKCWQKIMMVGTNCEVVKSGLLNCNQAGHEDMFEWIGNHFFEHRWPLFAFFGGWNCWQLWADFRLLHPFLSIWPVRNHFLPPFGHYWPFWHFFF